VLMEGSPRRRKPADAFGRFRHIVVRHEAAGLPVTSTSMSVDFTLQFTVNDLQLNPSPTWINVGSSTGSSGTHFSSANADAGVTFGFLYRFRV
jgi:hypothetical protein